MKKTLKKVKSIIAFMTAFVMVLAMAVPAGATTSGSGEYKPYTDGTEISIQIGVNDPDNPSWAADSQDTLWIYQVVQTTHNANNTLTHEFTQLFKDFQKDITCPEAYRNLTAAQYCDLTEDQLKDLLGNFTAYIRKNDNTGQKKFQQLTTDTQGIANFTTDQLGQYIVIGAGNSKRAKVYQTVTVEVQPESIDGEYKIYTNYQVAMKTTTPDIDKEASIQSDSVNIGDILNYRVKIDVPVYAPGAIDKTLAMTDTLPVGLELVEDSIKIYGFAANEYNPDVTLPEGKLVINDGGNIAYSVDTTALESESTFKVNFTYDNDQIRSSAVLVVTYNVKVTDEAIIGGDGMENNAGLQFANDPFVEHSADNITEKNDTETVYTYAVAIKKVDGSNNSMVLPNAEFELYHAFKDGEYQNPVIDENGKKIVVTTDATGYAIIKGLAEGTYYLKETKAPAGYNPIVNDGTTTIVVTKADAKYSITENQSQTIVVLGKITDALTQSQYEENGLKAWINDAGSVMYQNDQPNGYSPAYAQSTKEVTGTKVTEVGAGTGYQVYTLENNKGAQLPSTGGTGRKVFYVVGPILMVGAGIVLVTRKRMEREDS